MKPEARLGRQYVASNGELRQEVFVVTDDRTFNEEVRLITSFGVSLNKSLDDVKAEALQSVRCRWPGLFEEEVKQ